uniref:Uncharacterized protein n=1 Tax=Rhizophora mucronata TaxID=61149 RepID=A0A2P2IMU8_RHIMU
MFSQKDYFFSKLTKNFNFLNVIDTSCCLGDGGTNK